MTVAADLPWSAQQREWLQALGHDVLRLAATGEAAEPALPVPASAPPVQREVAGGPKGRPVRAGAPARSPLLRALASAAGRDEDDAELLQVLPDLATLRGNPHARRALWPRLRALRRRAPR
jgi:hypothetical protein